MGVKVISKKSQQGTATLTKKHGNGAEEVENILVENHNGASDLNCKVCVEMGNTVNTGNFESSRFSVSITMPCTKDGIDDTYEACQEWVNDKLTKLNQELQEQLA